MKRTHNAKMISILLFSAILAAGCSSKAADPANGVTEGAGGNAVTASAPTEQSAAAVSSDAAVRLASQDANELADFDENDGLVEWSEDSSTSVAFSDAAPSVNGAGASAEGGVVTIDAAGTYVVSGTVSDGQLVVNAPEDAVVHVVLNGANISNQDGPALYVKEADKTIVTLQEGTDSSLSDVGAYADTSEEAPTATIYSKGDLTINGTGKLAVQGNVKDGITSKDDLKLMSGVIHVKAADDGIVGRDLVAVKDGSVTVVAGGDGIKSTNDTDADKGYVAIAGGTYDITSANDSIQAASSMLIGGGTFNLVSGGGSAASAKVHRDDRMRGGFGQSESQEGEAATEDTESSSAKALKAAANVAIANGSFRIDAADDALHSNGNVAVTGGEFSIASGDDGMHADGSVSVAGGTVRITKSYEGIEGSNITVAGGEIRVVASDDGVNVGGGNDSSGGGGSDMFAATDGMLTISGGYLVVDSGGDGLDSNGSAVMTGGTAIVNGPTENNNAPLDFNGTFEQSGGELIAAGSAGMAQAPSDASAQLAVMMTFPSTQAAGTLVTLTDSTGAVAAAYQPSKTFSSIVISSPDLKSGESYTISTGGTASGTAVDGLFDSASVSGSTKVVAFEMGDKVTYVNESGVTTAKTGGFGGGFRGQGAPGNAPEGTPGDGQGAPPSLDAVN